MSAFAGLIQLDGQNASPRLVEAMLERLRHRVTHQSVAAAQIRARGPLSLGSMTLLSTPQARQNIERPNEAQTLVREGLTLWLAANVRLDNREELCETLRLGGEAARLWSDERLILEAYARWETDAPRHLMGDFAFAIWDQKRARLFCARDRFGTKPFYYAHKIGQFFAFASEIKALWALPNLEKSLRDDQIANFILSRFPDNKSTFYQGIERLSPACWMEISPVENTPIRENRYWELNRQHQTHCENDAQYAQLVRDTFFESVRSRTRTEGRFASFLSGGLDSSAVAAVAERVAAPDQKPVATLSRVFDRFPQCDERQYIHQTLKNGDFEPIFSLSDDITALTDLPAILRQLDQPSHGPNACSAWAQYGVLQKAGFHAVLNGHGGDEVVFMGYGRLSDLVQQGDLRAALHEMRAMHRNQVTQARYGALFWNVLLGRARRTRGIGRLVNRSRSKRRAPANPTTTGEELTLALLSPDLRSQIPALEPSPVARTVKNEHFQALQSPIQSAALEVLDLMAGAHAINRVAPFGIRTWCKPAFRCLPTKKCGTVSIAT